MEEVNQLHSIFECLICVLGTLITIQARVYDKGLVLSQLLRNFVRCSTTWLISVKPEEHLLELIEKGQELDRKGVSTIG